MPLPIDGGEALAVTWTNVALGGSILLLDIVVCLYFRLGFAQDLIVAAIRCVVQLSLLGLILKSVFEAKSPLAVAALASAMLLLGANEVTFVRASKRTDGLVGHKFPMLSPSSDYSCSSCLASSPSWLRSRR